MIIRRNSAFSAAVVSSTYFTAMSAIMVSVLYVMTNIGYNK